jgi:hypothetical protein
MAAKSFITLAEISKVAHRRSYDEKTALQHLVNLTFCQSAILSTIINVQRWGRIVMGPSVCKL